MKPALLVCRTSWMDHYSGVTAADLPTGGGAWVKEHGFGHEAFNFQPVRNEYFGYVRPSGPGINLSKLGGSADDRRLKDVTVVWAATHPTEGGTRVVGWYLSAIVFAEYQAPRRTTGRRLPNGRAPLYLVRARAAVLLNRDERVFELPRGKGGIGQSNVWYPDPRTAAPILKYIAHGGRSLGPRRRWKPRLLDVSRRLQIEETAMKAAASWFADRGYEVVDVSMKHLGWDLEAHLNRAHLKIEVKGTALSADVFVVEVTPNEYAKMTGTEHREAFRLCVVTGCEDAPAVDVFAWSADANVWTTGDAARQLAIDERIAARISLVVE